MKFARFKAEASSVTASLSAAANSASPTSPVGSKPRRYAPIFARDRSKPIVSYCLPNSTASGSPTYPSPTTATTVLSFMLGMALRARRRRSHGREELLGFRPDRRILVELGKLGQRLPRSRLVSGVELRLSKMQPDLGTVRRAGHRHLEKLRSAFRVAGPRQRPPQRIEHVRIERCEPMRALGILDGLGIALLREYPRHVVEGRDVVAVGREHALVAVERGAVVLAGLILLGHDQQQRRV